MLSGNLGFKPVIIRVPRCIQVYTHMCVYLYVLCVPVCVSLSLSLCVCVVCVVCGRQSLTMFRRIPVSLHKRSS